MKINCVFWTIINGMIICATICCLITKSDAQCSQDINGKYRFGQGCGFLCHCLNSEQCDVNNGECSSGCDFDWTGRACQHKNIAVEGISRHLDNIGSNLYAPRANDRDLSTCSYTAEDTTYRTRTRNPWWRVWLPYTFTLKKMKILTIDSHRKYFNGFKVIVENVPEDKHADSSYYPDQSQICYTHSDTSLASISMTVTCDHVYSGNQVRIELANKETQLVLCDIRIYGDCAENVCGYDCNKVCYCKDITANDKDLGTCSNGCRGRWSGINGTCDTECANDKWGDTCEIQCGHCRHGSPCDVVTGKCPSGGCENGYKDSQQCNIECDDGNYGQECQSNCSGNCMNNAPCRKTDGHCPDGCGPGYTGEKCSNRCPQGFYGNDCSEICSDNCNGGLSFCNNVDGICLKGCQNGYKGNFCIQECDETEWGMNCNKTCGKCKERERCDIYNGTCWSGCIPGYKTTLMCNDGCDKGKYGINCEGTCSTNCVNQDKCSLSDGTCDGCQAGWQVGRCDIACRNGTFGINCSLNCGSCQTGSVCNKTTGVCHEGCSEGFTGTMCTEKEEIRHSPANSSPVAGIAGGISGAVVVALVVVGIVIFLKRRQRQKKPFTNDNGEFSPDLIESDTNAAPKKRNSERKNIYVNSTDLQKVNETQHVSQGLTDHKAHEEEKENETVYYNTQSEHEVLLSELESYVKTGLASHDYFVTQFQQIPYGMQYPSDVATKAENHGKNRYKSMYAYDHSRVILKTLPNQPDTDYINATYIMGYSGENAYIAAQGPIANTLGDFWRLVWEQHVTTIVMATNLSEEGKMKCLQYWAKVGESVQHGNITAVTESEDIFAEFTVRRLKVSQQGTPGNLRTVTQFHYTAWPDKDVPRSTSSLLHFLYQVRRHDGKKTRPWLVHCSAGVGRTGTLLALDIQYDQGIDKGSVDVFKCVEELRKQRVNMVQTKDQYKYLHSIIVEALVLPSQPIHTDKFHSVYSDLKEIDPKTGKTKLLLQYQTLMFESGASSGNDSEDDIYISAKKAENKQKNRYDNILAPNEYRPFLLTQVPGCTDYINGVFIPGYRDKFGYILTQTPLKSTAIDCCRLVYEQEVKVIVTFQENCDDDTGIYLPEKRSVKLGPFTMTFIAEEDKKNFTRRDYQMTFQSEKRSVTQLIFKQWPTSSLTPSQPDEMLYFLEELRNLQRQNDNKPILAQCLNGAERSGLVVVLMNIFERLRFDQEVSIPLLIRQLKIRRQQIIPNFEQFKSCHDVVLSYIESDSTYANV